MGKFGFQEIVLILVIVLLLFGGKKIPELAKGIGKGIRDFKDAYKGETPSNETKKEESSK